MKQINKQINCSENKENKKNKGSATIVVILMFTITFIFAIATTYASISQNKKSTEVANWNKEYYELDAEATKARYEMKKALLKAEKKTMEYMYNKEYLKVDSTYLPNYAQVKIYNYYNTDVEQKVKIEKILKRLYFFYANAYLEEVINEVPEIRLSTKEDNISLFDIETKCTFRNTSTMTLELTEKVNDIGYDFVINNAGDITYTKSRNQYLTTTTYFVSKPLLE